MASLSLCLIVLLVITVSRLPAVGPLFPRNTRHRLPGTAPLRATSARFRRGMPRAGLGRQGKTPQLSMLTRRPTLGIAGTLPGITSGRRLILLVFLFAAASASGGAAAGVVMNGVIVVVLVHDERIEPGHVLLGAGGVQGGTLLLLLLLPLAG